MDGHVFLATTGGGTVRAISLGDSWSVESVLEGSDVRCLATDPLDPTRVFAGTQGGGVLRSSDAGRTWVQAGLAGKKVKSLVVSAAEPQTVYAGTKPPAIFASSNFGESWEELSAFQRVRSRRLWMSPAEPPGIGGYVQALAASPTEPGVLLAGIEVGGVLRTNDGGLSWSRGKGAIVDCHSLVFHASDGQYAYQGGAGLKGAAAISRDAGRTWTISKQGMDRRYGWGVAADPREPEIVYASVARGPRSHSGNAQACIFRTSGEGSWEKLAGGLPETFDHMPYALVTRPDGPGNLFIGLSNGEVWHTLDRGDLWAQLPLELPAVERSLVICS